MAATLASARNAPNTQINGAQFTDSRTQKPQVKNRPGFRETVRSDDKTETKDLLVKLLMSKCSEEWTSMSRRTLFIGFWCYVV